jgi:general secretion pathway protein B
MSFILNALRKSEQERRNLEAETLNDKILPVQPLQKSNKTAIFLGFLIIGNLFIIAGVAWFFKNNSNSTAAITTSTAPPAFSVQEKKISIPNATIKPAQTERPSQKIDLKPTSIAELIEEKKPEPVAVPLPVKPIITKKPAIDPVKPVVAVTKAEQVDVVTPVVNDVEKVVPTAVDIVPVHKDIPFLSDLPIEFRQSIPKIKINVFVYSQHPEERFVMIDMVKYKQGQQIKDALLLKEILPASLLIVFQNQEFQIQRP